MKTFKQYFEESTKFVMDKAAKASGLYTLVNIDVQKFDDLWKQDKDFYVGPNGTGAAIGNRYERFKEFLKTGVPIETSRVDVTPERVGFGNGRHRFAVLRDMGVKSIPVAMGNSSIRHAQDMGLLI